MLPKRGCMRQHSYAVRIEWTGNDGEGTKSYRSYRRDHTIGADGKSTIAASSDPAFRGDATRFNPEDLLVASLSGCHMLTYLHLCAVNGVNVVAYRDDASGVMCEREDGGGAFAQVELRPKVTISMGDRAKALQLHEKAHHLCFIANSVNFPVEVVAEIVEDM